MKFYVRLIIIVIAIIGGLWLVREYGPSSPQQSSSSASAVSSPTPQGSLATEPSAGRSAGQGRTVLPPPTNAGALGGGPQGGAPTPAPVMVTPEDPAIQKFREMARAANVELVGYRRDGDWFVVTVRSPDRGRLFEFLDVAQRFGLRSLDTKTGPQYREYMGPGGRLYHEATHRMKF